MRLSPTRTSPVTLVEAHSARLELRHLGHLGRPHVSHFLAYGFHWFQIFSHLGQRQDRKRILAIPKQAIHQIPNGTDSEFVNVCPRSHSDMKFNATKAIGFPKYAHKPQKSLARYRWRAVSVSRWSDSDIPGSDGTTTLVELASGSRIASMAPRPSPRPRISFPQSALRCAWRLQFPSTPTARPRAPHRPPASPECPTARR
jgi:hypothetical protein